MMRRVIYEKAIYLLSESNTLSLSIVDKEGYPSLCNGKGTISKFE